MTNEHPARSLFSGRGVLLLALIAGAWGVGYLTAGETRAGEPVETRGVFLFREPVERAGYFNEWWAYPIDLREPHLDRASSDVMIIGEGKTVEFRGVLRLGDGTAEPAWQSAGNFEEGVPADELERLVPRQVVDNALAWHRAR